MIEQLERYFCVFCSKSASLAMHGNVIRELKNNSSITKYKIIYFFTTVAQ